MKYDYQSSQAKPAGPDCLRGLLGENFFNDVEEVDLSRTKVTDDGLEHLKGLTQLRVLNLRETSVSDSGLVNIDALTNLEELDLAVNNIRDPGMSD